LTDTLHHQYKQAVYMPYLIAHILTDTLHLQYKRAEYVSYQILDMFYKGQECLRFYINKLYLCLFHNATDKSLVAKLLTSQIRPNIKQTDITAVLIH
jgi:hypothetical protein